MKKILISTLLLSFALVSLSNASENTEKMRIIKEKIASVQRQIVQVDEDINYWKKECSKKQPLEQPFCWLIQVTPREVAKPITILAYETAKKDLERQLSAVEKLEKATLELQKK